uniref:DUF6598 domain-containing protein n=1 Tax=Aegilops tauschii TaxID=37682 RepID=R7W5M1_AEGTA
MESESGMGTEGESGKGQDLLLDLGRKLGKMEIELGKWTEQASGKEQETVRDLKKRHRKLSKNRRYLLQDIVSGKFKELYSDSGRNRGNGVFREAEELDKELMIIKEKEKEKQETVVDSGEEEMGRDSARHQSLMEGQLRKEQERLRKVRYQLKKKMRSESDKDPAMQRMLLSQQQILWTKEQALLTVMRQSGMGMGMGMEMEMEMEMEMDSDSDSDSGSGSGSGSGHEMDERDSSKEPVRDAGGKEGQMANDLVGVLSGHLGMLKREISFLRTEVKSRGLAGNRACQEQIMSNLRPLDENLLKKDPFLHLIGPSRAIVAEEPVMFQIELKLKYGANFKDTASFTSNQSYRSIMPYDTMQIYNRCCTAEISLGRVAPAIQATIVGVCVTKGEWPFKYGCKVSCFFSPADATEGCEAEVVLLDRRAKRMRAGSDGYLSLSRNVVSVGLQGTLRVITEAYSESGLNIVRKYHAEFPIQQSQIDSRECSVDGSTLKIVVAWSRLVIDKDDLVLDGY